MHTVYSFLAAAGIIVALMVVWLLVQLAWRKHFPGEAKDQDALEGRVGCCGCALDEYCEKRDTGGEVDPPNCRVEPGSASHPS